MKELDRFNHLTPMSRLRNFEAWQKELDETDYDELVEKEQELFDLKDWEIKTQYARGEEKKKMERKNEVANIRTNGDKKQATLTFHEGKMKDPKISKEAVVDHELAHIIINPYDTAGGVFQTGLAMEETQTVHIGRACQMLRETPERVKVKEGNGLKDVVEKARRLTRLDENDWNIRIKEKENIRVDGERQAIFAHSKYHEDCTHLGLLSARQIDLEIDRGQIEKEGKSLPKEILRSLWRVVLNPYHKSNLHKAQENKLDKIMGIMDRLGWEEVKKK